MGHGRRRRCRGRKRSGRRSDPEHFNSCRRRNKDIIDDEHSGWDSLDERVLLDYMDNVAKNNPLDEMEVVQKLSTLNVSAMVELPEIITSDVDTVYSELPSATLLDSSYPGNVEKRYCRKRFSKRNRKRTKKVKMLSFEHQQVVDHLIEKHKKPVINWCKQSSVLTDDSQTATKSKISDTSSRGLTDSDSPTVDDIIMLESSNESSIDGLSVIEEDTVKENKSCIQPNSDSELVETTTDSGCDGDDEESSVEVSGSLKFNNCLTQKVNSSWDGQSSADDDDDARFQQIINGSFPLVNLKGQKTLTWSISPTNDSELFKDPKLCGIQGHRGNTKFRKKPESCTITTPQDLWQRIDEFIQHETEVELHLPMLSRALCRTASKLAQIYCLEYIIQQKRRLPVAAPLLRKTSLTCLASKTEVESVLKCHQRELQASPILWTKRAQRHPHILPVRVPVSALCYKTESMTVVGGDAPPIQECNVGNQILRNMGWKPGNGLGAKENGICDPIRTNRRPKYLGLGYKNNF